MQFYFTRCKKTNPVECKSMPSKNMNAYIILNESHITSCLLHTLCTHVETVSKFVN